MDIFSLELEQYCLAGLLRHPETFAEVDGIISENDFSSPLHKTIFGVIRQTLHNQEKLDKVLLAEKIDRFALSFEDKISSVLDYLNNITLSQVKASVVKETAKELNALSLRRRIAEVGSSIAKSMLKTRESNPEKIVAEADHIYS